MNSPRAVSPVGVKARDSRWVVALARAEAGAEPNARAVRLQYVSTTPINWKAAATSGPLSLVVEEDGFGFFAAPPELSAGRRSPRGLPAEVHARALRVQHVKLAARCAVQA